MLEIWDTLSELEEFSLGRSKPIAVDLDYIHSSDFRRKFDEISDSPNLQELLYHISVSMLEHRSGSLYEDMYWIDLDSQSVIAKETDAAHEQQISYSDNTKATINKYDHILTLHSHPCSHPPSIDDFNSNFQNGYALGLVVCHDGRIFAYHADQEIEKEYYYATIANYICEGYNIDAAQIAALAEIQQSFDISFKEVVTYDGKL